jgi:hypothetical protein
MSNFEVMPGRFKMDKNSQKVLITTLTVTPETFEHNDTE